MARVFVTSDDETASVEVEQNQIDGSFDLYCRHGHINLTDRAPADWNDAIEVAGAHADACQGMR